MVGAEGTVVGAGKTTREVDLQTHTLFVCTTCKVGKREDAPSPVQDGVKPTCTPTGPEMFRRIVERLSARGGHPNVPESIDIERGYEFFAAGGDAILRVQPQKCLNACGKANCVAMSHPTKYQYHFSMLHADSAADIEDLIKFVDFYCQTEGDAFTKKADRPPRLATNLISRLPPPLLGTSEAHGAAE